MASGNATVKNVISGDTVLLVGGAPAGQKPPEMQISLTGVRAPRLAIPGGEDEPFAFEAKEYLRKMIIGKPVAFKITGDRNNRQFGSITFEGADLAETMATAGYVRADGDDAMQALTEAAQAAKQGMFQPVTATAVRKIATSDNFDLPGFASKFEGRKLNALVEYVMHAGCVKVLIMPQGKSSTYISAVVFMTGIVAPKVKGRSADGSEQAEPYAHEAKHFLELRCLGREVELRLEGTDQYGNLFGTIYHPKGLIVHHLLMEGFCKISEQSAKKMEEPAKLRECMKKAQAAKKRIWQNHVVTEVTGEKEYMAKVIEVSSGDCIIVKPLNQTEEKRLYLASLRAPKLARRPDAQDDPWAFEAYEFCRKKLAGKKVKVVIDFQRPPFETATGNAPPPSDASGNMHYATLFYEGGKSNLNIDLVKQGLVALQYHRAEDDRADCYDDMIEAEKLAKDKKAGIHSLKDPPVHRVINLLGPNNSSRAKSFTESMKRSGQMDCIVEHVFNAGRFKLRVPSQNAQVSFALAGVKAPATARPGRPGNDEPYSHESTAWARELVMQRDGVACVVYQSDKGGNFIGQLLVRNESSKWVDYAELMLAEGCGHTQDFSLQGMANANTLIAIEKKAQEAKKGQWAHREAVQTEVEESVAESLGVVAISHVENAALFYVQRASLEAKLTDLMGKIAAAEGSCGDASTATRGNVVLAQFSADGCWYRAKVENKLIGGKVKVLFIDFGNSEEVQASTLKALPANLDTKHYPVGCIACSLSALTISRQHPDEAAACLVEALGDGTYPLFAYAEKKTSGGGRAVLLYYNSKEPSGDTVNAELLKYGHASLDKWAQSKEQTVMARAQETAKRGRVGMWAYGEGDDDDEDMY
mmetsp:Transcript_45719/g.99269  ORF Transcript_45719/g.99269 Transcript_45719/m.99269 type:complete len:871 (+) Transcript_45719:76-2688(+)|eukprot:CAMPEP_0204263842 /NCGR_PEP_ID=MMETSP0468-20130131/8615_1 /ASSEMBLY_ACC=CAM_ASM_000383 /TAXON_ID=2969 /ORGANISM="Oxyrrhis marina" /LENGTH=870 /DNA_ID=CAMNT_0051238649 /DNA_START=53 /DNA_END=2665 /DNA_ORIENTATION=+